MEGPTETPWTSGCFEGTAQAAAAAAAAFPAMSGCKSVRTAGALARANLHTGKSRS